jgi:hypothetical protein
MGWMYYHTAMLGADKAVGGPVTNNGHVSPVDFDSAPTFVLENNSGHLVLRNTANSLGYLNDINSTLGRRLSAPVKGVNIVNGKKVVF